MKSEDYAVEGVTVILPGATGISATSSSSEAKHHAAMNTETRIQETPAQSRCNDIIRDPSFFQTDYTRLAPVTK